MNLQTMQLDNATLRYRYIIDLIDSTECFYQYCDEDNCGYISFYNNVDLSIFCEEVCNRLDIMFQLERCYNLKQND